MGLDVAPDAAGRLVKVRAGRDPRMLCSPADGNLSVRTCQWAVLLSGLQHPLTLRS